MNRYGRRLEEMPDDLGVSVLTRCVNEYSEAFVIGPITSLGTYLTDHRSLRRATMQGGFVPYSVYRPTHTLAKFEDRAYMPTFNLNGDVKAAHTFLAAPMPRQMVGKNVCHTVQFNRDRFARFGKPINRASELFCEAASLYLETHDSKAFHDPTAAVCHLHPEVGLWMDGKTVRFKDGWTTVPGEDKVLVDLDHEAMWHHLQTWT